MVTCTGHIGIHEGADGRTDVRMYVRTLYVRTDVHDVMAIKPNFLTSMGYHIFLSMVLRARAPSARAELRYHPYKQSGKSLKSTPQACHRQPFKWCVTWPSAYLMDAFQRPHEL